MASEVLGTTTNRITVDGGAVQVLGGSISAEFLQVPSLGVNVVSALEAVPTFVSTPTVTYYGTSSHMRLSAKWRG